MAMPNYIHTFTAKTIDSNMFATISADIVSSTSLSVDETIRLKQRIEALFALLKTKYPDFYGRQIKGDYIECVMQNVSNVFRIALVIKSYIKSFPITENKKANQICIEINKKRFCYIPNIAYICI